MNNITDDLYLGNINPNEFTRIVHEGYKKLAKESVKLEEWLLENLDGDSKCRFSEFMNKDGS